MLSVVRIALICVCLLAGSTAAARDLKILVIGEGAAANCNAHVFGPQNGVYQIGLDGAVVPARDPFIWGGCTGGSIWMALGEKIIKSGMARTVTFMPVAVSAATVAEFSEAVPGGASHKLRRATQVARTHRFDFAFWQQGESDTGTDAAAYLSHLNKVIKTLSLQLKIDKWLIARGADCRSNGSSGAEVAQGRFGRTPIYRRFPGPDTSGLGGDHFSSGCNLSQRGQLEMAERWLAAMAQANVLNAVYEKESLLYYFR
jgi:hypothetical protein